MKKKKALKVVIEVVEKEMQRVTAQGVNGGLLDDAMFGDWHKARVNEMGRALRELKKMRAK